MTHEQIYVQDIITAANAAGQVEAIRVEVGQLAPIPSAELEAALRFTGWKIEVVERPGVVQCRCGYQGAPTIIDKGHDYTIFACPSCDADFPMIIDGKDVVLRDVTVK